MASKNEVCPLSLVIYRNFCVSCNICTLYRLFPFVIVVLFPKYDVLSQEYDVETVEWGTVWSALVVESAAGPQLFIIKITSKPNGDYLKIGQMIELSSKWCEPLLEQQSY